MKKLLLSAFVLLSVVLILHLPFQTDPICFLAAAAIHELGHVFALGLCGYGIKGFSLSPAGLTLQTDSDLIPYQREILIFLAGPLFNALGMMWCLYRIRLAPTEMLFYFLFCHGFFMAVNLLPICGLDGYGALTATVSLLRKECDAEARLRPVHVFFSILLIAFGTLLTLCTQNASLLFLSLSLFLEKRKKLRKNRSFFS
ncbi:MAG: hypothetical protein IKD31_03580 [Clostridia bacterium]|nr:hypothetical protein [Clostridia bacterium]